MKNMGDGRRVARVEKEIQIQIAQYLRSGFSNPLPGLVTVAAIKMPADLRTAKVYISVLGEDGDIDQVIRTLQERAFEVQDFIGSKLKMRYCPKLTFLKDHTTEQVLKIEKLLSDISQNKTTSDEE